MRDSGGGGGGVVGLIVAETGRGVLEIVHRAAMMTYMLWLLLKGNLEPWRLKDARRSRTRARSESSTSPSTHRSPIESSSSSRWLASSMLEHIDDDLAAM